MFFGNRRRNYFHLSVVADYCGENIFCHAPYKCCETRKGCCYDSILINNNHIRPQIWNMWYFWFLVIFMMMSCFGGCGYYRRRRLAMLTRVPNHLSARPVTVLGPLERSSSRSSEGSIRQFHFFAYNGPGATIPQPVSTLPPPYAEVISQPGRYPINKVELPPYPEDHQTVFIPPDITVLPRQETSLPPPYSEPPCEPLQPSLPMDSNMSSHCTQSHQWDTERSSTMPNRDADTSKGNRN